MPITMEDIANNIDASTNLSISLVDWRPILANECQVYVLGENYIAKRFDHIHYKFCEKNEAKEILVDNLYALLRYKYFPKSSEEVDGRIKQIVDNFTMNLKSTLKRISFDDDNPYAEKVKLLPDGCLAFRNGVFNFRTNKWLFKYDIIKISRIYNVIYMYDPKYIILWYLDIDFEPVKELDIMSMNVNDFVSIFKQLTVVKHNYCFELIYNMSHNMSDRFDEKKFTHIIEIIGYLLVQSFSQHFVLLVGNGQNGKNSLFDGCFIHRVIPAPAANDLNDIENDRFITGALVNKAHNIFLEADEDTHTSSKMLKAITGSMYQTIQNKGMNKYSGYINCKYIFSCNDQEKIKFNDATTGFRRRINILEIFYQWDEQRRFMKRGDYYDTSFREDLYEIKSDIFNMITFIYLGMLGMRLGTRDFTKSFSFTENNWKLQYNNVDMDLKEQLDRLEMPQIVNFINRTEKNKLDCRTLFYDIDKTKLYESSTIKELGYYDYDDLIKFLKDDEAIASYFTEHEVYISLRLLQSILGDFQSPTTFTQSIKKIYGISSLQMLNGNKPYVKCTFVARRLKILT